MSAKPDSANLSGRSLHQVGLYARDLERTKKFYAGVLGLPFLFEAGGMLFFQLKGSRLMIGKAHDEKAPFGGGILYFDAPDIDALGPALEAKGVKFSGPAVTLQDTGTYLLKLRSFADPDANALALMGLVAK